MLYRVSINIPHSPGAGYVIPDQPPAPSRRRSRTAGSRTAQRRATSAGPATWVDGASGTDASGALGGAVGARAGFGLCRIGTTQPGSSNCPRSPLHPPADAQPQCPPSANSETNRSPSNLEHNMTVSGSLDGKSGARMRHLLVHLLPSPAVPRRKKPVLLEACEPRRRRASCLRALVHIAQYVSMRLVSLRPATAMTLKPAAQQRNPRGGRVCVPCRACCAAPRARGLG